MASQEIVRVLRLIEYVGPRDWVESTIAKSIGTERRVGGNKIIRVATLGAFPEVVVPLTEDWDASS